MLIIDFYVIPQCCVVDESCQTSNIFVDFRKKFNMRWRVRLILSASSLHEAGGEDIKEAWKRELWDATSWKKAKEPARVFFL